MTAQSANSDSALESAVRDVVREAGFDLEALEQVRAGRRRLVRVIIDSEAGAGLDDIATVSRTVSDVLDERDELLTGSYTLEVSSPGVDRQLTLPRHWRRNRLRLVRAFIAGEGELVGRVGDCDDDGVTLLVAGALRRVRYTTLDRAVVEVEFNQPPPAELAALEGGPQDSSAQDLEER